MPAPLRFTLALSLLLAASGCSTYQAIFGSSDPKPVRREQPLEVPPDLTSPAFDERYAMPDPRASTSLSQFNRDRAVAPQASAVSAGASVLPVPMNARLERAGDQRWVVARAEPGQVWVVVREFWLENGFAIAREVPQAGILETDWRETRPNVERGGVRGLIGRALPGNFSSSERDRYRVRLERGAEPGTTEVFVTHRGLEEVFVSTTQDQTRWVPRGSGSDRDLEAEMLGRILAKLAEPTKPAPAMAAVPGTKAPASSAPAAAPNASLDADGGSLLVKEGFDRGWRRVGLALDRAGFTVEDRDRTAATYFVRYIDPDAPTVAGGPGMLDKLAFWRPTPKASQPQFRIRVEESPPGTTRVSVQNAKGEPDNSSTAKRILSLLLEQLR